MDWLRLGALRLCQRKPATPSRLRRSRDLRAARQRGERAALSRAYPEARFLGTLRGEALAAAFSAADVFVFPSLTDTFGNVLLEALASGLPVAAFPVTGPSDIITDPSVGVLNDDLGKAARSALLLSRASARTFALRYTWEESARQFRSNVLAAHHLQEGVAA